MNSSTTTNNCQVKITGKAFSKLQKEVSNHNKVWNTQYSLNDIKGISLHVSGVNFQFSSNHYISFSWEDMDDWHWETSNS